MHKGYTTNYFIDLFKNTPDEFFAQHSIDKIISPKKGKQSQAFNALDEMFNGELIEIERGLRYYHKLGSTPKERLIDALKQIQRYGFVFVFVLA